MYLVDTNIWLERLLDQERSAEVGRFLSTIESNKLLMTDFTLHSIGIVLVRLNQRATFLRFVEDLFIVGSVEVVSLPPQSMEQLIELMDRFNLDFDDAYQYLAAEQSSAVIVSFDGDFDRTDRGRRLPLDTLMSNESKSPDT